MLHVGLGQTPPACSPGYYPPPARCPDYVNYKLSLDPSGSGCQRCDALSQVEASSQNCMRALQFYLQGQGQLSLAAVTGQLNPETSAALARRLGPSWAQYPGGACAILASIGTGVLPTGPGGYAPYYPPPSTPPVELLLVGGGLLLLIVMLARK